MNQQDSGKRAEGGFLDPKTGHEITSEDMHYSELPPNQGTEVPPWEWEKSSPGDSTHGPSCKCAVCVTMFHSVTKGLDQMFDDGLASEMELRAKTPALVELWGATLTPYKYDRELLRKGAAAIKQCAGETRALAEVLDGIREELGLEDTHYLVMEIQVADVIRLLKETVTKMSQLKVTSVEILWVKDSNYPQSKTVYHDFFGEHELILDCPKGS